MIQILWERTGTILFSYMVSYSWVEGIRKFVGKDGKEIVTYFANDDTIHWAMDEQELREIGTEVYRKAVRQKDYFKRLTTAWKEAVRQYTAIVKKISKYNAAALSTARILSLLEGYFAREKEYWDIGILIVEAVENAFPLLLQEMLRKRAREPKQLQQYAMILGTPPVQSFTQREEQETLQLAKEMFKIPLLRNAAAMGLSVLESVLEKYPRMKQKLRRHTEKYQWLACNYFQLEGITEAHFLSIIAKMKQDTADPARRLKELAVERSNLRKQQQQLIRKLGLNKDERLLIKMIQTFAVAHDDRKKFQMMAFLEIGKLVKELSTRTNVDLRLVMYLAPTELRDFMKGKIDLKILEDRRKLSYVRFRHKNIEILTGKAAQQAIDQLATGIQHSAELNGICGSSGKVTGTVKLLRSAAEIDKMQAGEILVTAMTTPDYAPAMKRAAAIVTDEGGIMCHAAIVARELGVPCVVGTKFATKLLKDGMKVEVAANHGIVRIRQ